MPWFFFVKFFNFTKESTKTTVKMTKIETIVKVAIL